MLNLIHGFMNLYFNVAFNSFIVYLLLLLQKIIIIHILEKLKVVLINFLKKFVIITLRKYNQFKFIQEKEDDISFINFFNYKIIIFLYSEQIFILKDLILRSKP